MSGRTPTVNDLLTDEAKTDRKETASYVLLSLQLCIIIIYIVNIIHSCHCVVQSFRLLDVVWTSAVIINTCRFPKLVFQYGFVTFDEYNKTDFWQAKRLRCRVGKSSRIIVIPLWRRQCVLKRKSVLTEVYGRGLDLDFHPFELIFKAYAEFESSMPLTLSIPPFFSLSHIAGVNRLSCQLEGPVAGWKPVGWNTCSKLCMLTLYFSIHYCATVT